MRESCVCVCVCVCATKEHGLWGLAMCVDALLAWRVRERERGAELA